MEQESLLNDAWLDRLTASDAPAACAWFTRVHRELARICPGEYVFRLGEELEELVDWLEAEGIDPVQGQILPSVQFDYDLDGPSVEPEGGWCVFDWREVRYRLIGIRVQGQDYDETHCWVACRDRQAAEALVTAVGRFHSGSPQQVLVFEEGRWEEAPRLAADLAGYDWDSVVLPEPVRTRLRGAVELFFRSEAVHRELGIPWKLGFLFTGPPGTGKTLTTKVLANQCGVPFLYVRGFRGLCDRAATPKTVRKMFQGARDRAPCILCLEDVDSLVTDDLRSNFLNELDGLDEGYRGVLTVATTNYPDKLDAALLHRPARFDYRFEFPLPDEAQRRAFVLHWTEKLARLGYVASPEAGVERLVRHSRGMSQAYLKRVLVTVTLRMHTLEERGDEAFTRLALEELADATGDRSIARRAVSISAQSIPGTRVGFNLD